MYNHLKIFSLNLALLVGLNIIGHYFPPFSILFSPIIILLICFNIFKTNINFYIKSIFIVFSIIVNDISLRLYAGGTHDSEGIMVINLFFYINFIIALISFLIFLIQKKEINFNKIFFLIICFSTSYFYINYFYSIGMEYSLYESDSINISKNEKLFISNVEFTPKKIIIDKDTLNFEYGWAEKGRKLNHKNIFKKTEITNNVNWIIKINGNFDKNDYNFNIYYKIHDTTEIGATPINKTITFTTDNKTKEENIFIYKDGDWENFKKITIKRK
jgi:hypothetical protein